MKKETALLLWMLAAVFAAQFAIYLAGAASCIYVGLKTQGAVCAEFGINLQRTFETAIATILALLGGRSIDKG